MYGHGDAVVQLQKQLDHYASSLFQEGFLDDQFNQLRAESNPGFAAEVVALFFEDTQRLLNELEKALSRKYIDFKRVYAHVHQLKGSSSSIGAQRVQKVCIAFQNCCKEQNVEGCLKSMQQIKQEYSLVKYKLKIIFKMEQQLIPAGSQKPGEFILISILDTPARQLSQHCSSSYSHGAEEKLKEDAVISHSNLMVPGSAVKADPGLSEHFSSSSDISGNKINGEKRKEVVLTSPILSVETVNLDDVSAGASHFADSVAKKVKSSTGGKASDSLNSSMNFNHEEPLHDSPKLEQYVKENYCIVSVDCCESTEVAAAVDGSSPCGKEKS